MKHLPFQSFLVKLQLNLSSRTKEEVVKDTINKASVAAIFRWKERKRKTLQILFIRRADNKRDVWSGQVAIPGGRRQLKSFSETVGGNSSKKWESSRETAIRETFEEVGLRLDKPYVRWIGQLEPIQTHLRSIYVTTEVFLVDRSEEEQAVILKTQPKEVANVFWVNVEELYNSNRYHNLIWPMKTYFEKLTGFRVLGQLLHRIVGDTIFPCIYLPRPCPKVQNEDDSSIPRHHSEYILWGLTLQIVLKLCEGGGCPLPFANSPFRCTNRCGASLLSLFRLHYRSAMILAIGLSIGLSGAYKLVKAEFTQSN